MLTKNSERYVGDAVRSVSSQSNQNFELIIQDGMSDDRTLEIIKNEYPDAKVVSESDQNTTEAATKALARCSGSIIGFVDSDNMLPDDALFFVENYFNSAAVYLSPLPFNEKLNIFVGGQDTSLYFEIYSTNGRLIQAFEKRLSLLQRTLQINTSHLKPGSYILKSRGATTKTSSLIIKE